MNPSEAELEGRKRVLTADGRAAGRADVLMDGRSTQDGVMDTTVNISFLERNILVIARSESLSRVRALTADGRAGRLSAALTNVLTW